MRSSAVSNGARRLWAPRWVGPMMLLRGILQPLTERRMLKDSDRLAEAVRLASDSGETQGQDPLLGVAAQAIE